MGIRNESSRVVVDFLKMIDDQRCRPVIVVSTCHEMGFAPFGDSLGHCDFFSILVVDELRDGARLPGIARHVSK